MNPLWSKLVHSLTPYTPGEQPKVSNLVKLNTNENPYPPSPLVLEAIKNELGLQGDTLRLYPDPNSDTLKRAIADYFGTTSGQVFVGNGSDEVLAFVFQALLKHDTPILFPDITYSFYPVYCGLYEIDFKTIPLKNDFSLDAKDYCQPNGGIIFPNPNAPTGSLLDLSEIEKILIANSRSVVVIDEAYIDFGGVSARPLIDRFPNLLVIQTLSKSRSLAGLRIGFAIGNPSLIEALERVKNSFNSYPLDRLAIVAGTQAIRDVEHFKKSCSAVIESRTKLSAQLEALGFSVTPSAANFLFVTHPNFDASQLCSALRDRNVIVRHFRSPRIDQYLRISIGNPEECQLLVDALSVILK